MDQLLSYLATNRYDVSDYKSEVFTSLVPVQTEIVRTLEVKGPTSSTRCEGKLVKIHWDSSKDLYKVDLCEWHYEDEINILSSFVANPCEVKTLIDLWFESNDSAN